MTCIIRGSLHRRHVILPFLLLLACARAASAQGISPHPGLALGSDGNFYGTTVSGGSSGDGTVFKVTPTGTLTTLLSFNGQNGKVPISSLTPYRDGNFYGTTRGGGAFDQGTVFKITPSGTLTTLFSFNKADGSNPWGGLVVGKDGNFYGTTYHGGAFSGADGLGYGTVFKVTPTGTLTVLHNFTGTDGANPLSGLTLHTANGSFYGTAYSGGAFGYGTVYHITSAGALTILHSFDGADGELPQAELSLGLDGNYYSTTAYGGATDHGTVFRITLAGTLTVLHSFDGADGTAPLSGLALDQHGNFYGTTYHAGANPGPNGLGAGTVFQITKTGVLTTLANFSGATGDNAYNTLAWGLDGNLYGETNAGGGNNNGTVYKITLGGALTVLCSL